MTGKVFTGRILPALGLLIALAGLGLSIYLSVVENEEPADGRPAAAVPLTASDFPAAGPEPGHQVGYRIPDFALELADGRAVTAADLVARGQPTFLFFWATT